MLDWLIIGGGVHGTHLSLVLTQQLGASPDRVRVLDPYPAPMQRWKDCVAATGMRYLRSPSVHHIGLDPFELLDFGEVASLARPFEAPYSRPSVELFHRHCRVVCDMADLASLRLKGRALGLSEIPGGYAVETEAGCVEARRVVLAIGAGDQPRWPSWALRLLAAGVDIRHIFEPNARAPQRFEGPVLVVGGGLSGTQVALRLASEGAQVTHWSPHATRVHQFDSDPGWVGAKNMRDFSGIRDPDRRRAVINKARHNGSVTPQASARLRQAESEGAVRRVLGPLAAARALSKGMGALIEVEGERPVGARHVVLCTGFDPARPGGALLDEAIDAMGLRCASCGYPVPTKGLEWRPGLFVMGPLAELELGPAARNIIGARRGAQRIATVTGSA